MASLLWTVRASHFRNLPADARQSVQFRLLWMPVDKWITCGLFPGLQDRIEDQTGEHRTASDKSCKVGARVGTGLEHGAGLGGVVDPAAGDDLETRAEPIAEPAHVFERRGVERRAGQTPR